MGNPVISVKNLSKTFKVIQKESFLKDMFRPEYKDVNAVNNISFEINEGESVAFLGPNGAGKTTTTKMMTGLMYPSSGEINVLGYFPFDRKKEFLMQIGLVMGNKAGLNWDLTPNQSFDLLRQIYKIEKSTFQKRLDELLTLLDTKHVLDTQVRKLSLGERMKMELIGAILHNPKVLFLDEPTIGLDIIARKKIRKFLRKIQQDLNITIILTSHDMDDIEEVCDRVIVINKGEKVYDDSLESLSEKYQQFKYVKLSFDIKPDKNQIPEYVNEILSEDEFSYTFKLDSEEIAKIVADLGKHNIIKDIEIISTPLEEIIQDIFEGNG